MGTEMEGWIWIWIWAYGLWRAEMALFRAAGVVCTRFMIRIRRCVMVVGAICDAGLLQVL